MLTGQYYYYLKTLDEIRFPLTADQAARLDILGLKYISATAFSEIDQDAITNELKNLFISSYLTFLKENELEDCVCFWIWLTTPLRRQEIFHAIKPKSDFQRAIRHWGKEGFQFKYLDDVIKEGRFSTREDDLALLYGLTFLQRFTNYETLSHKGQSLVNNVKNQQSDKHVQYSTKPQILVVTTDELAPLFMSVGCEAIPLLSNQEKMVEDIRSVLQSEQSIKVVLIEGEDVESLASHVRKNIDSSLLVSTLTLPRSSVVQKSSKTFFDAIAKSTLGVRLD